MEKTKQSITKHNQLIHAGYRLTLNEIRILQYGISLINPILDEFPLEYEIDIKKFIYMFGLKNNTSVYTDIKDTVMGKFKEREFTFDIGEGKKEWFRWLVRVTYADHLGYIKIYLNPFLKPWLHQLTNGHFTSYNIDRISGFKSTYSVRLYEMSIMRLNSLKKDKCSFTIEIDALKEQLGLTEKYKLTSNFKLRVLESAKKEISKHSDIRLSYTFKKQGRAFHEIKFLVAKKKPKPELITTLSNPTLSAPILEKAKHIVNESGTNWELQEIEKQFFAYTEKAGNPKNLEGAFIGFVKNKIKNWAS